jgi:hypothetical protein
VHAEALAVMVAVTADFGFGDPSIIPYSAHTMVCPLSCSEPFTGSVRLFLCYGKMIMNGDLIRT